MGRGSLHCGRTEVPDLVVGAPHIRLLSSKASPPGRLSLGDSADSLPLAEVSWPLVYGAAIDLLGSELIHRYVGVEGYSVYDSPFTLTKTGLVQFSDYSSLASDNGLKIII